MGIHYLEEPEGDEGVAMVDEADIADTDDDVAPAGRVETEPRASVGEAHDAEVTDSVEPSVDSWSPSTQGAGSGLDAFDDLVPPSADVPLGQPDDAGVGLHPEVDGDGDAADDFDGGFA